MRKLIVKGKEFEAIRVLVGEDAVAQNAAAEFVKYMGKMGIPEGEGLNVKFYRDNTLGIDGYRISIVDENTIEFVGDYHCGMIYSVYDFLKIYAGARFFTPRIEHLGTGDIVFDEDYAYTPAFERRTIDFYKFVNANNKDWSVKNHITCNIPEHVGEAVTGYAAGGCHTFQKFSGVPQGSQPCLSDPEMLKKAIAWVRQIIAEKPGVRSVSVTQNDGVDGYCTCEKCAAITAAEGSPAGNILRFVNAIAEDISKDYPDVMIETFAYSFTQTAPKITKAHPNVYICLCSINNCFSHSITDSSCALNRKFHKDMDEWRNVVGVKRIHIWDYVADFGCYIGPTPNFITMRDNMRYYAEHNVKAMYPEGPYDTENSGEFGELRTYLLAQLMWNPYMDGEEYYRHMDEFLAAYYGEGWQYIRAYIDWSCAAAMQDHMRFGKPFRDVISREKWEAMEETIDLWWNKALEMAGDKAENVKTSRIQWDFMKLELHPDAEKAEQFIDTVESKDITWSEGKFKIRRDRMAEPSSTWYM